MTDILDIYGGFLARVDDALRVLEADPLPVIVVRYPVRPGDEYPTAAGMAATLRAEREAIAAELAAEVDRMAAVLLDGEPLDGRAVTDWPLPLWIPETRPASLSAAYLDAAPVFAPEVAEWARARGLDRVAPGLTAGLFTYAGDPGAAGPAEAWINGQRWPAAGVHILYRIALDYSPRWAAAGAFRGVWALLDPIQDARIAGFDPSKPAPVFAAAVRLAASEEAAGLTDRDVDRFAADLFAVAHPEVLPLVSNLPKTDAEARATVGTDAGRVLAVDHGFATVLEGFGSAGYDAAAEVRRKSGERVAAIEGPALFDVGARSIFRMWTMVQSGAPVWLGRLARVLWLERWRVAFIDERRRQTPAFPIHTVDVITRAVGSPRIVFEEGAVHLRDRNPRIAPDGRVATRVILGPEALADWSAMTPGMLQSIDAHGWLLRALTDWQVAREEERPDFRLLRYEGGFERLEDEHVGSRDNLAKIIPALARLPVESPVHPGQYGNMYAYNPGEVAYGRRRSWFEVTAGSMIQPGAIKARPRWDRACMPIPGLPPLEGIVTRRNEYGALATLRLLVVRDLRDAGGDLLTEGGALLTLDRWRALIDKLEALRGVRGVVDRVVAGWPAGGSDYGPFLIKVGPDRYHLHPSHVGARAFLDEGARQSIKGAERAKRGGKR